MDFFKILDTVTTFEELDVFKKTIALITKMLTAMPAPQRSVRLAVPKNNIILHTKKT